MGESSSILPLRHAPLCLIMMLVKIISIALVLLFCCAMAEDETSSDGRATLAKAYEAIADDAAVEVIDEKSPEYDWSYNNDIVFGHRFDSAETEMIEKLNDDETVDQGLNAVVEEVTSKKNGRKTSEKMLNSMRHRVQRWKKRVHKKGGLGPKTRYSKLLHTHKGTLKKMANVVARAMGAAAHPAKKMAKLKAAVKKEGKAAKKAVSMAHPLAGLKKAVKKEAKKAKKADAKFLPRKSVKKASAALKDAVKKEAKKAKTAVKMAHPLAGLKKAVKKEAKKAKKAVKMAHPLAGL